MLINITAEMRQCVGVFHVFVDFPSNAHVANSGAESLSDLTF